jgi:[glutamine synthetase] adenylyltransferase / [glutamine synthetase]-adenylyl-L-tyrosine phosphorylase
MSFRINPLGDVASAITAGRSLSPYLERLCLRREATRERLLSHSPRQIIEEALHTAAGAAELGEAEAMRALRHAKADLHLACAAGDLSFDLDLHNVTHALTSLADIATASALEIAARHAAPRDTASFNEQGKVPGLFILALGKHGANELNYSSDIDLVAFFDRSAFQPDFHDGASSVCVRIIQTVSRLLDDVTPDGYVFRVDWRLRPDPASTQVAVSVRAAEAYYESVGQNWERAALIKARPIAGDLDAAQGLLAHLKPFIWRKNLDFAAIGDIQSILRQIHAVRRATDLNDPAFDVKLGRGGIREIEFFTQTQQLILGGRDSSLRGRRTLDTLDALVLSSRIEPGVRDDLVRAYTFLRMVEHRIQMLDDEQTHKLPADPNKRARVAGLCGLADCATLDAMIRECRQLVRDRVRDLFPDSAPLSSELGSLVFTGVDDDPETLVTLSGLGFNAPSQVARAIRGWHHGRVPATRTARARELLTALTPDLLKAIAATGEPDAGFKRFQDFFAALPAGVQVLSLFKAEPQILAETCATLALAPLLGEALAKRPAILDAMLSPRFSTPLEADSPGQRHKTLAAVLESAQGFEQALDLARRTHREEAFRIGFQVLHGRAHAEAAGPAYTDLAEAMMSGLLPVAQAALQGSHGTLPTRIAVCGWGKLGGRELAADSDLDLMIVYDCDAEESDGKRPLSSEQWHTRLTQRLVSALSAPTAEGQMYEVDMQLRPSGRSGPIAVRLSALERYYQGEAWTWEYQALTRLRAVAGDKGLQGRIKGLARRALGQPRDRQQTLEQIVAMRQKMAEAHKVRGAWDIKRQPGGLIDLEFFAQFHQLIGASQGLDVVRPGTLEALSCLAQAGILNREEAGRLIHAGGLLHDIRQLLALAAGPTFDPDAASLGLQRAIARALNVPSFEVAKAEVDHARAVIREAYEKLCAGATE